MPHIGNRVTKGVQPPARIKRWMIRGSKDDSGRPDCRAHRTGTYDSHAYCPSGLITRACDNGGSETKAGSLGTGGIDTPADVRRFIQPRQHALINLSSL